MNRYTLAAFFLAVSGLPAMAQVPITGATPPWSPPSPTFPPGLIQVPARYRLTDQAFIALRNDTMPEKVLSKLRPIKDNELSQEDLVIKITQVLTPDELNQWKNLILTHSQIITPTFILVPAGKPLVGYYKMEAVLVGADNRYPFDTGDFNLAGLYGNARLYGKFYVPLPPPADVDPLNASVPYRSFRGGSYRCR